MKSSLSIHLKLRRILSDISKQSCDNLDKNEDLFGAGILDSYGVIEFVLAVEQNFGCTIPQKDLIPQNLWSIESISNMLIKIVKDSKGRQTIENR